MLRIVVFSIALGFLCIAGCGDAGPVVTPPDMSNIKLEPAEPPPGYSGAGAGKGTAPAAASMPPAPVDD